MAEGYAHATGRPGVAMVTSGPAATNIVTPLCDAYMDSVPMVVHHRPGATAAIGTDAFQECDTIGITQSVTKHNYLVTEAAGHPPDRSARRSTSPPPAGPARCSSTSPRTSSTRSNPRSAMEWYWPDRRDRPARLQAHHHGPPAARSREAAELILAGRAPGDLRRRRHPQGPGRRGAARAGRAARHPRRHHADGPGRLPRRPPAVPRHAGHARQLHRGHRRCRRPTC